MSAPTHLLRQRLLQPWNSWRMERRQDQMASRSKHWQIQSYHHCRYVTILFVKIWEAEVVWTERKHEYLVWKGDLGLGAKLFFSIPSQEFWCIVFERLRDAIDKQLWCKQEGFRKDKSCTDHIATLRIIVEQSNEWQLYHFTWTLLISKRSNSDDRNVIWKLMYHYGIPSKFIKLIQDLYGAEEDVKSGLGKAGLVLNMVRPVWPHRFLPKQNCVSSLQMLKLRSCMDQKPGKWHKLCRTKCKALLHVTNVSERSSRYIDRKKNTSKVLWSRTGQKNVPTEIARQK